MDLPAGSVTLLFTDIEGSTRLIEKLGEDGYVQALFEHRRLLRSALSEHGGVEVDTQGDAFLFAFVDPVEALAAAADGQEALASGPVLVRMGVHTGELQLTGEGYAGRELHRAARIAASGHGGQVVVSAATGALVGGELIELGEHHLKDFDEPVALFQLGAERFPPLKTISNTNLPRPASSFVGRQREREELLHLLRNGSRLVTLSGPGGSGKTRLALEVAAELVSAFKAGVFWVGLAPLRDPALVLDTVAQTLGAKDGLTDHVGERELLLLLDNFEQVTAAAPELSQLLAACPNLRLLVTSRELLRIAGEFDYPVPPLARTEAVALFCERSHLETDEVIAELCCRLDDMPLAVELAAARTRVLTPTQILDRLSQRLDLLKGGRDADPRQLTLRATIDWSHELLSPREQTLFRRLAVFSGGCSLDAAEEVAGAELEPLQSLVDKSLLRHTNERFWMLETIRAYGRERLAGSADEADLRRRHALHVLDFAESADPQRKAGSSDLAVVYERVDDELGNVRAALEWARDSREDEIRLRLTASLEYYWRARGLYQEQDAWNALALERGSSSARARMSVLNFASARAANREQDWARANALVAEWLRIAEQERDEHEVLRAMNAAALHATYSGDFDEARRRFTAVGKRAAVAGDSMIMAFVTVNLSVLAWGSGDFNAGIEYAADAAKLFRELGEENGVAVALSNGAWCALALSDPARAAGDFQEALGSVARHGALRSGQFLSHLSGFAASLVALHVVETGVHLLGAAEALREEVDVGLQEEGEKRISDNAIAAAKAALGDDAFAAAWERGEAMTPEEAMALALATRVAQAR